MDRKIVVAVTGASGSVYAKLLLEKLHRLGSQVKEVGVVLSDNARQVWELELGDKSYQSIRFTCYDKNDFTAPFASGSARFDTMIICPCSMGTMSRIATGTSNDLITRAADVTLKERRKLILVLRDTPYSLIHIRNMQTITEAGGIICPASPSFYHQPKTIDELAESIISRIIDLADLQHDTFRWGETNR